MVSGEARNKGKRMRTLVNERNGNEMKSYGLDISEDLRGIRGTISTYLFKSDIKKALLYLLIALGFYTFSLSISYIIFKYNFYYLYPLAWFLGGMGVTSIFVLGHDCAHGAFFKSNKLNDLIGHLALLIPMYPYHAWKFSHNAHHRHTNLLKMNSSDIYYDNAWTPLTVRQYKALNRMKPGKARTYRWGRYFPPFGAIMHNILTHFYPDKFNVIQRKKVLFSYITLSISFIVISSTIYYLTKSIFAIFHLYLLPAIFFSFWMSLYTYQHHTSENMKFYSEDEWNPYKGQINSTYNSISPYWLSILHLNIDIHTPHHLSTAIPCYHLREAYSEIKKSIYGDDLEEGKLSFKYYWKQVRNCHLWDEKNNKYVKFSSL